MSARVLKVFSGDCCECDVGIAIGHKDHYEKELHTGDIILVWHGNWIGTDLEQWSCDAELTAVISNQYQSYSDGSVTYNQNHEPFVMGIKSCGFSNPEWRIQVVKKYSDVIEGEHWTAYGFNYRHSDAADAAKANANG